MASFNVSILFETPPKKQCAAEKKTSKITASEGFKLSLFRYPEDVSPKDQPQQQQPKKSKGKGKI